jgi:7-keto-8-aminopelargonate synthetase-like enzyme
LANEARSPIFQLSCDSPRVAFAVANRMRECGFYCCVCVFPAVPMNRPGLRFTITRHNDRQDIEAFVAALAESMRAVRGTNAQPLVSPVA